MNRCPQALRWAPVVLALFVSRQAMAEHTPGYPERVLQWTVLPGETCDDISQALYGSTKHRGLLQRYNNLRCAAGEGLPEGMTLTVPAEVTEVAPALLDSLAPNVREKPPGGQWEPANPKMALYRNHSVNTLERARADILFVDRSRIVMAAHTLVVIYGTAERSNSVSVVPSIELESGELQAGLQALGGKAPVVAVKSGGDIQANSTDTVVRHKQQRSTVSVFDGDAKVRSGGSTVTVPQNFGTSFRAKQQPLPPRPLPDAPSWQPSSDDGILLSEAPTAVINAVWLPVANTASYRVEFARDPQFRQLLAREEVGADVTSFRAESMPEGDYFLRVRVIDNEDFLGKASLVRHVTVVKVAIGNGTGSVVPGTVRVAPYAILSLKASSELEIALDDGAFGAVPPSLDLMRQPVSQIRLRHRTGGRESRYAIVYEPVPATLAVTPVGQRQRVVLRIDSLSEADVTKRVVPQLRVARQGGSGEVFPLSSNGRGEYEAWLSDGAGKLRELDVVDARGQVIAQRRLSPAERPTESASIGRETAYATGPCAPFLSSRARGPQALWAPTACDAIYASWGGQLSDDSSVWAWGRASAQLGRFGLSGTLRSDVTNQKVHGDDAFWLAVTHRSVEAMPWSMGPALRLAIPTVEDSPATRGELGWAIAWQSRRWSFIGDAGLRARFADAASAEGAPPVQAFLLGGAVLDWGTHVSSYAQVEAQLLRTLENDSIGRFGLALGAETKTPLFVAASLHVSPWQDSAGVLSTQLSLGVRQQ